MKVTNKKTKVIGYSHEFNIHALSEIIVYFEEGDCDSEFISDYEVELKTGWWKDMQTAFKNKDIIPDNYNIHFREARNWLEKSNGYY